MSFIDETTARVSVNSSLFKQSDEFTLDEGIYWHQCGDIARAEKIYKKLLLTDKTNADVFHLLGLAFLSKGQVEDASSYIKEAIRINSEAPGYYSSLGNIFFNAGDFCQAKAMYSLSLEKDAAYAEGHFNLANAEYALNNLKSAIEEYHKALDINPSNKYFNFNLANTYFSLKDFHSAIIYFERALKIDPCYCDSLFNLGNAHAELNQFNLALFNFNEVLKLNKLHSGAYNNKGNVLRELGEIKKSIVSFESALEITPHYSEAHYNLGLTYLELKNNEAAKRSFTSAIQIDSGNSDAYYNLGIALTELKRFEDAINSYSKAISLVSNQEDYHFGRGLAYNHLALYSKANDDFSKAWALNPNLNFLLGNLLLCKLRTCDWENFATLAKEIVEKIVVDTLPSKPFPIISFVESIELQHRLAINHSNSENPFNASLGNIGKFAKKPKIRLGYYSADFYNHATCLLMAELFEKHDKSKFELFAFSFGPDIKDHMRTRVEASFDQFIDVSSMSDKEIAEFSRMLGIDIAIDLKGSTKDHRFGIFSYRAAPVQVSYLGYPGTMGAEYIDYLIADKTLIPEESQKFYTEKIAYMPHSYQVNDRSRVIADRVFTKQEVGLPEEGFVFACFNSNYKITPDVFDVWVRILQSVEGSVLWLFEENKTASANLRKEAQKRGLAPEKLVFAPKMELSEHLARHKLADLFIDTLPCNAHTTASDALWAGLPVLTCMGESFASRVAASLLNAIEMPELITSSLKEYEELAVALGKDPQRIQALKQKLESNKLTTPLFDSTLFTQNIEKLLYNLYNSTH